MITPPKGTTSFYAAIFDKPAAEFIVGLLAPHFSKSGVVKDAMITSLDFESDINAVLELQHGVADVVNGITGFDEEVHMDEKFNPIYLPTTTDFLQYAELNEDDEIVGIDGFNSPFVIMSTSITVEDCPNVIEGRALYRQFTLQTDDSGSFSEPELLLS